jgi:hypothetical protein
MLLKRKTIFIVQKIVPKRIDEFNGGELCDLDTDEEENAPELLEFEFFFLCSIL